MSARQWWQGAKRFTNQLLVGRAAARVLVTKQHRADARLVLFLTINRVGASIMAEHHLITTLFKDIVAAAALCGFAWGVVALAHVWVLG
jgi:hypothetical protein